MHNLSTILEIVGVFSPSSKLKEEIDFEIHMWNFSNF